MLYFLCLILGCFTMRYDELMRLLVPNAVVHVQNIYKNFGIMSDYDVPQ